MVLPFLNLGDLPLGNAFLTKEQFGSEKKYRLELGLCRKCSLVQQTKPPPTGALEQDYQNYAYVPFGETLATHYHELASQAATEAHLSGGSFVVDVGSNSGLLLKSISHGLFTEGWRPQILGVEPAEKISETARKEGVPTITAFFSKAVAEKVVADYGQADLVVCTQTLQHIPDLNGFVDGLAKLMKPTGRLLIEGRYFKAAVEKTSYDTMYHEMLYFFTLNSLSKLLQRHDLYVMRATRTDVYGGSLRVYATKEPGNYKALYHSLLWSEIDPYQPSFYDECKTFANSVKRKSKQLHDLVKQLRKQKKRIAAYGAPSTSATLLNYSKIGAGDLTYVVDDSPLKQGLYTPGTHIKIVPSDVLDIDPPDYLLLTAWRLREDILPKVRKLRNDGMRVIIPLPEVSLV